VAGLNLNVGGFNLGAGAGAGSAVSRGCGGGCGAIVGVFFGIILIPVGFYLAYHSEARLINHGKVFESVEMAQPDAAKAQEGELVKISGQAEGEFITIPEWDGQALYVYTEVEEYEREEDAEGDVDYEWKTVDSDTHWASFTIGSVAVRPQGANAVGEEEVYSGYKKKFETAFHVGTSADNPEVGDRRKSIEVLDATRPVIVLGQMSGGTISGGTTFVVSTQSEEQTTETLKSEYKMAKWGMRFGAVMCIFVGIMLIFGPLTMLVGYIPIVGDQISCLFAVIAFAFAALSVTVITLFIKAFWFLVAAAAIVMGYMIYRGVTTPRGGPGGGEAGGPDRPVQPTAPPRAVTPEAPAGVPRPEAPERSEEAPEPEAGPRFCPNCGAELAPDSKFCAQCGQQVRDQ